MGRPGSECLLKEEEKAMTIKLKVTEVTTGRSVILAYNSAIIAEARAGMFRRNGLKVEIFLEVTDE